MRYQAIIFLLLAAVLLLAGCSDLQYYSQSAVGHMDVMSRREPIEDVLADPERPDDLKQELREVLHMRHFASSELLLPDNGSYRSYADLERPYVVWNIVAAPEFSLAAIEWCFPVAGCLPYRGYFDRDAAEAHAGTLRQQGYDVHLYGVTAYSTLGWFDDPVLNTFIDIPEWAMAGIIFHELAHQLVYVQNDADFNEAFARVVEMEGIRRWLERHERQAQFAEYQLYQQREEQFLGLVMRTRLELLRCFAGDQPGIAMRTCKEGAFDSMKQEYELLKTAWEGYRGFDGWFRAGMNNARFIAEKTYREQVPAFRELLRRQEGDLGRFYAAVGALAEMPREERRQAMLQLRRDAPVDRSALFTGEPDAAARKGVPGAD